MIDLIPLQDAIEFNSLASPKVLTEALAILIVTILGIIAGSGVRLRSPAVMVVWSLTLLVLFLTFITGLPFIWFWVLAMANVVVVAISCTVQYMF